MLIGSSSFFFVLLCVLLSQMHHTVLPFPNEEKTVSVSALDSSSMRDILLEFHPMWFFKTQGGGDMSAGRGGGYHRGGREGFRPGRGDFSGTATLATERNRNTDSHNSSPGFQLTHTTAVHKPACETGRGGYRGGSGGGPFMSGPSGQYGSAPMGMSSAFCF